MTTDQIIEIFEKFVPFDEMDAENDNILFLYELTDLLVANGDGEKAIAPIFQMMEKYPEVDFGSPGPLVHTIEKFRGSYEIYLYESLQRKPTSLTVWMLNRIINSENEPGRKSDLIEMLRSLLESPVINDETRESIQGFINFQSR
ncbi:hypothetical protein [Chitinophaga nivalis]|uniref:Immunity protein 30 domain-containing protein n=1 Tax=Chitinophaga nivalis TaxID=2991709 RepID=A0ABT3IQU7_9BACT|nr:hypothetical protein [Chitinophaga nivalis]MCW3463954.1 hypothetical protein [Chitinophaga nivalis]MCW3486356.1 hypothetical protein [Chitinophaga nivalis]